MWIKDWFSTNMDINYASMNKVLRLIINFCYDWILHVDSNDNVMSCFLLSRENSDVVSVL